MMPSSSSSNALARRVRRVSRMKAGSEGAKATADHEAATEATRNKTARLRSQRLAKRPACFEAESQRRRLMQWPGTAKFIPFTLRPEDRRAMVRIEMRL